MGVKTYLLLAASLALAAPALAQGDDEPVFDENYDPFAETNSTDPFDDSRDDRAFEERASQAGASASGSGADSAAGSGAPPAEEPAKKTPGAPAVLVAAGALGAALLLRRRQ